MGVLLRFSGVSLFLLLAGLLVAAFLGIQREPLLPDASAMTTNNLQRVRQILASAAPGEGLRPGAESAVTIRSQDMELLLNYLLENLHGGRSRVTLQNGAANLQLSAALPAGWPGGWLNVQLGLSHQPGLLAIDRVQVGALPIPRWLARGMMQRVHAELLARIPEYSASLEAILDYSIKDEALELVYQWQPELFEQLSSRGRDLLIDEEARERLLLHVRNLAALVADPALPRVIPLPALLGPMFVFAREQGGDAVEQNRAALLAFFMYVTGIDPAMALGQVPGGVPQLQRRRLTLGGRQDFARHFLISAGLAASAGTGMADTVGILKEMDDSVDGGSGFSFRDLAANRAGIRFAELAVTDQAQAAGLQQLLADSPPESVFIPDFNDLPERITEEEFMLAYGTPGSPAYEAVIADIDERLANLPLFLQMQ